MTVTVRKRSRGNNVWEYYLDIYDNGVRCLKSLSLRYTGDKINKEVKAEAEKRCQSFKQQYSSWFPLSLKTFVESAHYVSPKAQRKKVISLIDTYGDINILFLTDKKLSAYFCKAKKKIKSKRFNFFIRKILDVLNCMYQQGFITVDYATLHRANGHTKSKVEVLKHVA